MLPEINAVEPRNSSLKARIYRDRREGYSEDLRFENLVRRPMSRSVAGKGRDLCGRRRGEVPELRAPEDRSLTAQGHRQEETHGAGESDQRVLGAVS